ncbi:hypothetical protein Tco_0588787 [Tanacetum coccineum]
MPRVTTRVVPRGVSTVPSPSGQPPPDDRSTVVNGGSQRWSTAVNATGQLPNDGGQRWRTTVDHRRTTGQRVNDTLNAELERYKEHVKVLNEGQSVDLRSNDNVSDSCAQSVEIDHLKQTLPEHLKEKEPLMQTVSLLKDDFKKEESRNIDREIALEKRIKQLDNVVFKRDKSAQIVHMLTKP